MFDLEHSDELDLIVATAREFAAEALVPALREHEAARAVADSVRDTYAEIGLASLELPESLGGAGLGPTARAALNEELGAADPGAALALDPLGPAIYPLAELGGPDALGEHALPLVDSPGSRALLVTCEELGASIGAATLSGRVPWVPSDRVDLLVVLGAEGAAVVREGIRTSVLPGAGLRAAGAAELVLEDAPVAVRWTDPLAAARAWARARLYAASLLLGVLRHASEFSRDYALERVAFGRPIAHHQALAFLITDMHMAVDGARLLIQEAAWRAECGHDCASVAASALAEVVETSRWLGPSGVQILGGHGFMQDYPMEKAMREARALGLWLGGLDAARESAGRALCAVHGPVALSHGEAA